MAHSSSAAFYWSHAGSHFEMQLVGRWWATVKRDQWPETMTAGIAEDFEGEDGDRRQEIVFIGVEQTPGATLDISDALDWALLDDDEMEEYRGNAPLPARLSSLFPNPLPVRMAVV